MILNTVVVASSWQWHTSGGETIASKNYERCELLVLGSNFNRLGHINVIIEKLTKKYYSQK